MYSLELVGRNLRRASACPDTERHPRDDSLRGADHHQQPCEESLLPGLGSEEGRMKTDSVKNHLKTYKNREILSEMF